jgi:hypothetical protein
MLSSVAASLFPVNITAQLSARFQNVAMAFNASLRHVSGPPADHSVVPRAGEASAPLTSLASYTLVELVGYCKHVLFSILSDFKVCFGILKWILT